MNWASFLFVQVLTWGAHPWNGVCMWYFYILQSKVDASYYVGSTSDIRKRLADHNSGSAKYSSSKKPYVLIWYCAFLNKTKAIKFEMYLKNGSGFAFRNKHLI
jgi:predicted GIY-YIG superfamily endonuclease